MPLQKGHKIGQRFSTTNQPKKNGRKPTLLKQLTETYNKEGHPQQLSKEDAFRLFAYLLTCTKSEIEALLRNPELPFSIATIIRAMIADLQKGKADTVDRLFDLVYGKGPAPIEFSIKVNGPQIPDKPMSRKDYEALLKELM